MSDLLAFLEEGRHIFSVCPECRRIHRLSDLRLSLGGQYVPDWLDLLDGKRRLLEEEIAKLGAAARDLKREAKEKAERWLLPQRLRTAAPVFAGLEIDVRDVRTILHPVDYVAFRGMNSVDGVREISLIFSGQPTKPVSTIDNALKAGNVRWNTLTLGDDGAIAESKEE